MRRVLDRVLLGPDRDLQKALRTHSQQISLILDPGRLAETTLDWLEQTFGIRRSALILVTPQDGGQVELRILCSRAMPAVTAHSFAADSRFLVHFDKTGHPLSQYDLDMLDWFQVDPERRAAVAARPGSGAIRAGPVGPQADGPPGPGPQGRRTALHATRTGKRS